MNATSSYLNRGPRSEFEVRLARRRADPLERYRRERAARIHSTGCCGQCQFFEPGAMGFCALRQSGRDHDETPCASFERTGA